MRAKARQIQSMVRRIIVYSYGSNVPSLIPTAVIFCCPAFNNIQQGSDKVNPPPDFFLRLSAVPAGQAWFGPGAHRASRGFRQPGQVPLRVSR